MFSITTNFLSSGTLIRISGVLTYLLIFFKSLDTVAVLSRVNISINLSAAYIPEPMHASLSLKNICPEYSPPKAKFSSLVFASV